MDTPKSIKTLPAKLWHTLTKPPFAEVLLLLAVLIGMQQGYTILSADKGEPVAQVKPDATPTQVASAPVQTSTRPTLDIDKLVSAINNPDAKVHTNSAIKAVLVLASAKTQDAIEQAYQFSDTKTPALAEYDFSSTLKQKLFSAVSGLPFTPNALSKNANNPKPNNDSGFASWQAKQPITLTAKAVKPIPPAVKPAAQAVKPAPPVVASVATSADIPTFKPKKVSPETIAKAKAAARARAVAREKFVIMLDPGHGGTDPGSVGHNGLKEKILTLDIAKRAEKILEQQENIRVLLTRNNDSGMSRADRVKRVKNSYADMVVSLHLNHLPQADVNVVETFYAGPENIQESLQKQREAKNGMVKTTANRRHDLSFTKGSRKLASLVQKNVYEEVIQANPDTNNAGVKQDTLYILTRSFTPGVLIELSCLSNIEEADRLAHAEYRQKLAQALANGVTDYLNSPEGKRMLGSEV